MNYETKKKLEYLPECKKCRVQPCAYQEYTIPSERGIYICPQLFEFIKESNQEVPEFWMGWEKNDS